MKFDSTRDALALALRLTAPAVGKATDQPALATVRLTLAGNRLTARTTDLSVAVTTSVNVTGAADGEVLVPHGLLTKVIAKSDPGAVSVAVDTSEMVITAGSARMTVPTVANPSVFPQLAAPKGESRSVDASVLAASLAQVVPSASTDMARPPLTGVFVEGGEHFRLVATDGYRLALCDIASSLVDEGVSALVPAAAFVAVPKVLGTSGQIAITIGDRAATFKTDTAEVWTRLIESPFPTYRSIIPEPGSPTTFAVDRDTLAAALERAMLANADTVGFSFEAESVTITATQTGSSLEAVVGALTGEPVELRANPRYLLDGLTAVTGESVTLGIIDPLKPIRLASAGDEGFLYVFMPLK